MRAKSPRGAHGLLRRSWVVEGAQSFIVDRVTVAAVLANYAPYVGVVEGGARPHNVNRAGVDSITRWFRFKVNGTRAGSRSSRAGGGPEGSAGGGGAGGGSSGTPPRAAARRTRKVQTSERDIRRMVWGFIRRLRREGWKPGSFFVRNSLPELTSAASDMVRREFVKIVSRPVMPRRGRVR